MAGIGDYTKGKKFTLKSGNTPAFKMIGDTEAGDSPITNEFGIGKGTSPYRNTEDTDDGGIPGWKKALGVGAMALTGGLDAVYGSGKIRSMSGRLNECPEGQARNNDGECVPVATE